VVSEVPIFPVSGAEQGKNREGKFFFPVIGRFSRKNANFIV